MRTERLESSHFNTGVIWPHFLSLGSPTQWHAAHWHHAQVRASLNGVRLLLYMLSVWPSPNASENIFLSTGVNNKLGTGIKEAFHVKWSVVPSGYWRPDGTLADSTSVVCSCFLLCYSVTSHNSVWNWSPPLSLMALYKWLTDKTLKNNFPEVPHSSNVLTLKRGRGFLVPDNLWTWYF